MAAYICPKQEAHIRRIIINRIQSEHNNQKASYGHLSLLFIKNKDKIALNWEANQNAYPLKKQ